MKMKRLFTLIMVAVCVLAVAAQDIIVKNDGEKMNVYDLKVGTKFITYRLTPGGPSKRIGKAKVASYKITGKKKKMPVYKEVTTPDTVVRQFVDTVKVVIKEKTRKAEKPVGEVMCAVDSNNTRLIELYSKPHSGYGEKQGSGKAAKYAIAIMGVTSSSVLSNEDIEIEFVACGRTKRARMQYYIYVHNKSDKTIYLDLENTFRIFNNGTFDAYYNGKQIKQTKRTNEKLTLERNLSAYAPTLAGTMKSRSRGNKYHLETTTNTYRRVSEQKIHAIAPNGKLALPPEASVNSNNEIIKRYDNFSVTLSSLYGEVCEWRPTDFDETTTPYSNSFVITYSADKKFVTYSTMKFTLYAKQLIGIPRKISNFRSNKIHGYDRYTIYGEAYFKQKNNNEQHYTQHKRPYGSRNKRVSHHR